MSHALLIMSLIISQGMSALLKSLTDSDNAAVAENSENTFDELRLFSVKGNVLIVKKFNESLRHCKFHGFILLSSAAT